MSDDIKTQEEIKEERERDEHFKQQLQRALEALKQPLPAPLIYQTLSGKSWPCTD